MSSPSNIEKKLNTKQWEDISEEIDTFLEQNATECVKCEEFIAVFCDNPQFSRHYHYSQTHKPLSSVEYQNSRWSYRENNFAYVCPICLKSIKPTSDTVALSVAHHVSHSTRVIHRFSYIVSSEDQNNILSNIFSSSLRNLKIHQGYFSIRHHHLFCQLCNFDLGINGENRKSACEVIRLHISNKHHKQKHNAEIQRMVNGILLYNKENYQHQEAPHTLPKESIFSGKLINKNINWIKKHSLHYFCSLCNLNICYFSNGTTQKLNLIFHFNSEVHRKNLFYKIKTFCFVKGLICDGKVVKENSLGYTYEMHCNRIKKIQHQEKSFLSKRYFTLVGGSDRHGISAPPREVDQSTSQAAEQDCNGLVDTNKMNYESIRILNQYPTFAQHVKFLNFVDGNFMCTLCDVSLSISPTKTHFLKEHILGSRHAKYSKEQNIPVASFCEDVDKDRQLIATSPSDQIGKLSLDPELAPHVQYLQLKGNQCQCLLCGVFLSVSIYLNHNLREHILGSTHMKKFENEQEDLTTEDCDY